MREIILLLFVLGVVLTGCSTVNTEARGDILLYTSSGNLVNRWEGCTNIMTVEKTTHFTGVGFTDSEGVKHYIEGTLVVNYK